MILFWMHVSNCKSNYIQWSKSTFLQPPSESGTQTSLSVYLYHRQLEPHADVLPCLFVYEGWAVVEATAFSCVFFFPVSVPSVR